MQPIVGNQGGNSAGGDDSDGSGDENDPDGSFGNSRGSSRDSSDDGNDSDGYERPSDDIDESKGQLNMNRYDIII